MPLSSLAQRYQESQTIHVELSRLAHLYKVSTPVVLRRIYDLRKIDRTIFWQAYQFELKRVVKYINSGEGNFTKSLVARVGRRFGLALVANTLEGHTTYSEALRLLDIRRISTFQTFANYMEKEYYSHSR